LRQFFHPLHDVDCPSGPPSRKKRRRSSPSSAHRAASEGIESSSQQDSLGGNPLRNPLSSGQSTFSISADGKACMYIDFLSSIQPDVECITLTTLSM
jgi:hypothetical protein